MQRRDCVRGQVDRKGVLRARLRQPQDHVAVALARAAHGAQPVDEPRLKPNVVVAVGSANRSYPTLDGNVVAIASKAAAVMVMRIIKEKSGQAR